MLPFLNAEKENSKKYVVNFQGINLGEGYAEGEFSNTENVSCALAPSLSQRFGRELEAEFEAPTALHVKDGLLVIDGTTVKYNGKNVGTVDSRRKQLATIGNYVVIFPDKKYYRVPTDDEEGEFGSMEEIYSATRLTFTSSTISRKAVPDFPFIVGDEVTITGCSKEENNKAEKVAITSATINRLAFEENLFAETTEDKNRIRSV